jgi:chitinase
MAFSFKMYPKWIACYLIYVARIILKHILSILLGVHKMKTKHKIYLVPLLGLLFASCNSGGGSSDSTTSTTASTFANRADIASIANTTNSCFSVISAATTQNTPYYVSGTFNVKNSCSTAQTVNGLHINMTGSSTSLKNTLFNYNSEAGLIFPAPVYWAATTLLAANSTNGGLVLTVSTDASGILNPSSIATFSYGYNANGIATGAINFSIGSAPTPSPTQSPIPTPTPTPTPTHTPSTHGQIVGYFETWQATATWESTTYSIANIPSYVNIMPLAFARPDSTYVAGSYNFNAAGLGIAATPAVAIGAIKLAQAKGQKVLLSVGGATYQKFSALNVPATIALVKDLGLDGIDIDFEPSSGSCSNLNTNQLSCPTDSQLISIITQLRAGLDGLRPDMILTAAVWSIGAYGTPSYPTTIYGPVGNNSGIWVNPLKQVGDKLNYLFLMSYDAGVYTPTGTRCTSAACYDPTAALKAYLSLFSGPVYQGIEVPPEAWGGNVSTPANDVTLASTAASNGGSGIMIWALQVQGDGYTSNSYLQPICLLYNTGNASLCNQTIPQN